MASIKNHRPSEQTKTNNNNERSFTNKVKEMVRSARNIFTHQQHPGFVANNHKQNSPSTGTAQYGSKTEKKKIKKPEGSGGNCMPKMREHVKNLKNKKNREDSHTNNSSSGDSDDEKKSKRKN